MKFMILALAASLGLATGAAAQDTAIGIWQTEPDGRGFAHIAIAPCGPAFCGTLQRAFDLAGNPAESDLVGRTIVIDMVPQGGGEYRGKVWRPSNDKTYIGKMTVSGNNLRLQGCVAGGLLCASQNWVRAN